jgi:hypothetical protein
MNRFGPWIGSRRRQNSRFPFSFSREIAVQLTAVLGVNYESRQFLTWIVGTELNPHHAALSGAYRGAGLSIQTKVLGIPIHDNRRGVKLGQASIRKFHRKDAARSYGETTELQSGGSEVNRGKSPRQSDSQCGSDQARRGLVLAKPPKLLFAEVRSERDFPHVMHSETIFLRKPAHPPQAALGLRSRPAVQPSPRLHLNHLSPNRRYDPIRLPAPGM